MKKNKLTNYFLIIGFLTFITIFVFIVQESYSNLMKPINNVQNNNLLKPIDSNLDVTLLDQIEKRNSYFSSIEEASPSSISSTPAINE
jgi:hypothetical protein